MSQILNKSSENLLHKHTKTSIPHIRRVARDVIKFQKLVSYLGHWQPN